MSDVSHEDLVEAMKAIITHIAEPIHERDEKQELSDFLDMLPRSLVYAAGWRQWKEISGFQGTEFSRTIWGQEHPNYNYTCSYEEVKE